MVENFCMMKVGREMGKKLQYKINKWINSVPEYLSPKQHWWLHFTPPSHPLPPTLFASTNATENFLLPTLFPI